MAKVKVGGVDVYYTSLEKALSENAGAVEITLVKGKIATVPAITDRMVTLVGEDKEASIIDMTKSGIIGAQNANLELTIKNATVKFDDKTNYKGITHSKKVVYEGCIIEGKQFLYAESVEFKSCKLKNSNDYCLWTYGSANVLFDTCTFNTGGKAILIYNEETSKGFTAAVTVNNCIFNDDDTLKEDNGTDDLLKAAIETGSNGGNTETSNKYTIVVNNATVNGFAVNTTGINTGSKLWANKNSMDAEHLTVIIDGAIQLPQNATAETINKVITESKDAEGNVVKDVKLALPSNSTFELNNGLAHEGDKSRKVTIVGDGTQTVDVAKNAAKAEGANHLNYQRGSTFTFENVTVENGTGTYDGIVCDELIYRNCTIKGVTTLYGKATFIDCTFENEMVNQYSIWTWGGTDVKFEGCTFNTNGKAILLFGEEKTTNLTVTGCRFNDRNNGTAGKAAIEIGEANYGKHNNFTVVISDSEVVTGFAINSDGTNTGSKLWANKNSMDAAHLSVTIDGTKVL